MYSTPLRTTDIFAPQHDQKNTRKKWWGNIFLFFFLTLNKELTDCQRADHKSKVSVFFLQKLSCSLYTKTSGEEAVEYFAYLFWSWAWKRVSKEEEQVHIKEWREYNPTGPRKVGVHSLWELPEFDLVLLNCVTACRAHKMSKLWMEERKKRWKSESGNM